MMAHRGAPGVEYRGEADLDAQALGIGRNRAHCLRGSLEQEIVDDGLVLVANSRGESIAKRSLRPLPCSMRSSMRSESMSDTFSATTSETRNPAPRSEEHTSELQSRVDLVC